MYEQSLALRRELGDRRNIANALLNVGRVELVGDERACAGDARSGPRRGREVGDTWSIAVGLASLGRLALREGRQAEAVGLLRQALELTVERGGKRLAAECLAALGVAASSAAPPRSARLFGTAEALRRASGVSPSPIELAALRESLDGVREALGEDEFRTQFEAGLALPLEDAVTYALSESAAGSDGADREAELGRLLERVRDGFSRYDAGDIDAFEVDDIIHHYVRSTQTRADAATVGKPTDRRSARP